jgi:hypothetical protein
MLKKASKIDVPKRSHIDPISRKYIWIDSRNKKYIKEEKQFKEVIKYKKQYIVKKQKAGILMKGGALKIDKVDDNEYEYQITDYVDDNNNKYDVRIRYTPNELARHVDDDIGDTDKIFHIFINSNTKNRRWTAFFKNPKYEMYSINGDIQNKNNINTKIKDSYHIQKIPYVEFRFLAVSINIKYIILLDKFEPPPELTTGLATIDISKSSELQANLSELKKVIVEIVKKNVSSIQQPSALIDQPVTTQLTNREQQQLVPFQEEQPRVLRLMNAGFIKIPKNKKTFMSKLIKSLISIRYPVAKKVVRKTKKVS